MVPLSLRFFDRPLLVCRLASKNPQIRVELQNHFMTMRELPSIQKLRPALIACGILSAVAVLPLGIANGVIYSKIVGLLLNVVLAIVLLALAIFSSIYGYKLLRLLKNLIKPREEYIRKVINSYNQRNH
jgi:hypothetical protein